MTQFKLPQGLTQISDYFALKHATEEDDTEAVYCLLGNGWRKLKLDDEDIPLDIDSVQPLGGRYMRYSEYGLVYHAGKHVDWLDDHGEFEVLATDYGYGQGCIFWKDKSFEYDEIELETFVPLAKGYCKDQHHVFHENWMLEEADASSFQMCDDYFAEDKLHYFYEDKALSKTTTRYLGAGCWENDKQGLMLRGKPVAKMTERALRNVINDLSKNGDDVEAAITALRDQLASRAD